MTARYRAKFEKERDRRYAEVALEREKAAKTKETADANALLLAREIQNYKDEKANELRTQIERERGSYATQVDLKAAIEKVEAVVGGLSTSLIAISSRLDRDEANRVGQNERRVQTLSNATLLVSILAALLVGIGIIVSAVVVTR